MTPAVPRRKRLRDLQKAAAVEGETSDGECAKDVVPMPMSYLLFISLHISFSSLCIGGGPTADEIGSGRPTKCRQ